MMKYVTIGVSILLSIAFVAAGGAKLLGAEMMVATFDKIGIGQWFRYVTGGVEIGSVVLLWLPRTRIIGATLLSLTMIGGIAAHIIALGPSMVPAVVLFLLSAFLLYSHRDEIPFLK